MVTSFTDWNPNELYHFGTKGMKWGQRRFQNPDGSLTALGRERYGVKGDRTARGMSRDLNKLDREKVTSQYRIEKKQGRIARKDATYAKKIEKAEKSGKSDKANKLKEKREENLTNSRTARKVKEYKNLLQKNAQMTNRILAAAKQNGLKVSSKQTKRIVNKGALVAKGLIATAASTGIGLALGKQAYDNTGTRIGTLMTSNGPKYYAYKDLGEFNRNLDMAANKGKVIGAALGGAAGATVKTRKGTKYRVQNKYRSR